MLKRRQEGHGLFFVFHCLIMGNVRGNGMLPFIDRSLHLQSFHEMSPRSLTSFDVGLCFQGPYHHCITSSTLSQQEDLVFSAFQTIRYIIPATILTPLCPSSSKTVVSLQMDRFN